MSGESRYLWTHGIAARQYDEVHSEMPGYRDCTCKSTAFQSRASTATTLPRGTRASLTFRKVRRKPCICLCSKCSTSNALNCSNTHNDIIVSIIIGYPALCDSQ